MNDFTASNGIRVWIESDVLHADHPADYFDTQTDGSIQALREFFRAEEDERLGRWRWPENPDYVAYPQRDESVLVVHEPDGLGGEFERGEVRDVEPIELLAARAYFNAHPELKPWRDAKEGDVWVLNVHGYVGAWLVRGDQFEDANSRLPIDTGGITAGRRIWPEGGES